MNRPAGAAGPGGIPSTLRGGRKQRRQSKLHRASNSLRTLVERIARTPQHYTVQNRKKGAYIYQGPDGTYQKSSLMPVFRLGAGGYVTFVGYGPSAELLADEAKHRARDGEEALKAWERAHHVRRGAWVIPDGHGGFMNVTPLPPLRPKDPAALRYLAALHERWTSEEGRIALHYGESAGAAGGHLTARHPTASHAGHVHHSAAHRLPRTRAARSQKHKIARYGLEKLRKHSVA